MMIWEQINFIIIKSTRMSIEHFSECAVKFGLGKQRSFVPFNLLPVFLASQAPRQYTKYYLLSAVL